MIRIPSFAIALAIAAPAAAEAEEQFEKQIRPVLATRCLECHGVDRQDGGFRLDARDSIDVTRLSHLVAGESEAPASCSFKALEIGEFAKWIEAGLPWPASVSFGSKRAETAKNHWAFQQVREPAIPEVKDAASPVDAFVLTKLKTAELTPAPEADRRTLIRRLSYTLTGLPPSPQDVHDFLNDRDPKAYEKQIDRLLESDRYGEHWARHWLDVARYSDTKGYIYAREERFWTHAWAYRDWVVRALNENLPYDQFLLLQLAADQLVDDPASEDLAAMGFLTLGRRFLGVQREIIDDRIDVVTRGTMGLTVGCARCHDHKYDPIPTADYYSLYGVFASSQEALRPIGDPSIGGEAFQAELAKRREALQTKFVEFREASSKRARERIADYLFAQTELEKYPANGFDQIFEKTDLLPEFVHRWSEYLRKAEMRNDPVFVSWHAYKTLPTENFESAAAGLTFEAGEIHPLVVNAFQTPPKSLREVADRYGKLFIESGEADPVLKRVLHGPDAPAEVPDLPVVHSEVFFPSGELTQLWKLDSEIYRWIIKQPVEAPHALILKDQAQSTEPRIFLRGNPLSKGDDVPRQFLGILSGENREPFKTGSGRLEMAQAIVDAKNPLTARVIVNRVWAQHFGQGLVTTPSDFGVRADPPSHPQLLDWLSARFVAEGWSLKKLHRWILLSSTFKQSSKVTHEHALEIDPRNRLLWRMNPRRLSWEQFRDSMLAAADDLDLKSGGKPVGLFAAPYSKRRTIYGLVDRQFLPILLRTFDFANPDLHIPKRAETTVPQQALFFMNHPMVLDRARALASHVSETSDSPEEKVRLLFQRTWQRDPTSDEIAEALALVKTIGQTETDDSPPSAADWKFGYGSFDEKTERVAGFQELPFHNGEAWQGGEKWPDAKLGWIQLTAEGGHPGNDREHAAIRRWTAPSAMTIAINSKLIHEPTAGDGIRAFVVSSRVGKLATAEIHQATMELNVVLLEVEKDESIDFVVDIGKVLNSDQFLWSAAIEQAPTGKQALTWNSKSDFTKNTVTLLDAWEQLAQTMLCSNEFLFID
ncbi:MAG: hypothetical protein ACI8UO_005161 [Verrucomicrobiales bacterium]|jgi:hypothetical protein